MSRLDSVVHKMKTITDGCGLGCPENSLSSKGYKMYFWSCQECIGTMTKNTDLKEFLECLESIAS